MSNQPLLIVTGADEAFIELLKGLVESLHQSGILGRARLACLDLGLEPCNRDWLRQYTDLVITPDWDIPLDSALSRAKPHLRAITARPFLPRYFPGFDTYLWMDADTWVQEAFAIDWYQSAAADGRLAIAAQVDRTYRHPVGVIKWRMDRLNTYYGPKAAQLVMTETYFNAGVFALRASAPHWAQWANEFRRGVDACQGTLCTDQTALNYTIWTQHLPIHPLPALCNWMCHLAPPTYVPATGLFHEPFLPHDPIGILHLTGDSKDMTFESRSNRGQVIRSNFRFSRDRKALTPTGEPTKS